MSAVQKQTLVVGGLEVNVFSRSQQPLEEVVVFFLLHGRYGSANEIEPIARTVIQQAVANKPGGTNQRELLVVTFVRLS